jgi:hypothetical protein
LTRVRRSERRKEWGEKMRTLLRNAAFAATGAFALIAAPAHAQVVTLDPATFHVGADSTGGPGTDPNLIPSNSKLFVADISGSAKQDIVSPTTLYFLVPDYGSLPTAPSITMITLDGTTSVTFSGPTDDGLFSTGDFYKDFLGLSSVTASLGIGNLNGGLTANGIPTPAPQPTSPPQGYEVFAFVANTGFSDKDYIEVDGSFGLGTYIAPLGFNSDASKMYTTQFTNVGLIDSSAVPEPSTWAMMLLGFAGLGYAAFRRNGKSRLEGVTA